MLTPDYLAHCTDRLLGLYDELDRAIIEDIARRIVKTGGITPTARHQIDKVQQSGMLLSDVTRQVAAASGMAKEETERLFREAGITSMKNDALPLTRAGKTVDFTMSPAMTQALEAAIHKTNGTLYNLTMTTGVTAMGKYMDAVDAAYMKVQSGAFSYDQAIRDAIKASADDGNWVSYASGHRDRLDVAIRRAVLTGLNQTVGTLTELYSEELGAEYYETTAHAGARPSHAAWQGRIFSIKGSSAKYPNFQKATGYGTGDGLCGWNCRHSFFPYFPGLSEPAYTKKQLDWYDAARFVYNGEALTEYEVSQLMRKNEREIRATKRELAGYKAAEDAATDPAVKEQMKDAFSASSVRLKEQEAKYRDLCEQTNHKTDSTRTGVVATKDSSGRIVSWNRSTAQSARRANERVEKEALNAILEAGNKSGALNPDSDRANEHAARYYGLVRSMKTDVKRIARASGFSEDEVQEIKNFIFMEKHDLGNGKEEYFAPEYRMAQSWQRLVNGTPEKHDITLLEHERMERRLMKQGYSQDEAHRLTSEKFNYRKESDEYYDSLKEHRKKK